MKIVYFLIAAAAFFGIIAWFINRNRRSSFPDDRDAPVPFSFAEQEKARVQAEFQNRTHQ